MALPTTKNPELQAALERGETLPAEWYTNKDLFRLEQKRIFRRTWQYVGLTEQVAQPGDFFTFTIDNVPIVLTRDLSGHLRGFVNVCRHRGSQLVLAECGHRNTLQCHYHAWTYNLDGTLRAAPGSKNEPDFTKEDLSLIPVHVETWGPFIFVNLDPQAQPLHEVLGELPALVEATGLPLSAIKRRVRRTYEIAANWKVVVDNYLECYHCPVAHPAFADLIDLDQYTIREYDYFSTQTGPVTNAAKAGDAANLYEIGEGVQAGFYVFLWPNFTLNIYPGPGNVSLNLFVPLAVNKTLAIYDYCFVEAVSQDEERDFVKFIDQVQEEDIVLCESVQRGLSTGFFERGRLMLHRENALRHFQKLVYGVMAR
jgi:phenylpropionate dioxygenase-like ring-hydroxylating dioxygenase large terminal subunit